jgi:hypothetical protein
LGAHPKVVLGNLELLAGGFVDPVLEPAWAIAATCFRKVPFGEIGLQLCAGSCDVPLQ